MSRDRKEVFSEAYYAAIEDGKTVAQAEQAGMDAVADHEASLMDQADLLRKQRMGE
jgi:putative hemolysin